MTERTQGRGRSILRTSLRLLGPALLVAFLLTTDLRLVWQTLQQTNLWLMLIAVLLAGPFIVAKALRWQLLLRAWRIGLPLREASALYGIGLFLGLVTPGQAGDSVKAWYLRDRGHPLSTGLASVVVDRLFDIVITGLIAASGLYFFWHLLPGNRLPGIALVAGLLAGGAAAIALLGSRRLRGLAWRFTPHLVRERLARVSLPSLHLTPRQIVVLSLVSLIGLGWTYVRTYLVFLALDTPIPIGPFVALIATLAIVSPISPGGVGTRDALLVLALVALLRIDPADAVVRALSISTLLLALNVENIVIGFLLSLRYPLLSAQPEAMPAEALGTPEVS
ncbi:MAG: hypothetical protein RLZZ387_886 [Chloroflexota bacterium]|jgi:uncharacterized membrane protein YbhN (UPF0104 family)